MNAKPTKQDIQAATGKMMSDILAPDLTIMFCGINPSLYSVAVGHHFARPGNRFWKALHFAGFTDRLLKPFEDRELLQYGYGVTNIADRATARADQLTSEELIAGHQQLAAKVEHYRPKVLAVLGISAYRTAFARPKATIGRQLDFIRPPARILRPHPKEREQEVLAPFALGRSEGFAPLREEGCPDSRRRSIHDTIVWVLPNPSGLNAHYQLADLTRSYQELLIAVKV